MKLEISCAVICLIYVLTCMAGPSGIVHGKPLPGYLTKTQRYVVDKPRVLSRDLDSEESSEESLEKSSEESDSSEKSSEGSSEESESSEKSSEKSSDESDSSGIRVPTCPVGWSQNGTSCYLFVDNYVTWDAAHIGCQNRGSDLVAITSQEEQEFLHSAFTYDAAWIGLNDKTVEGNFVWTSSGDFVAFTKWGTNEPADESSYWDCVYSDPPFGWFVFDCDDTTYNYICERPAEYY